MPKKCFFIATSWRDRAVPKHFKALARALALRGHRVVVLIDGKKHEFEDHAGNPAVWTWPSLRPIHFADARFLYRLIRQYNPDCLVANFGAVNLFGIVGWLTGVPQRVVWERTLSDQHDIDSEKPQWHRNLLQARRWLVYRAATHVAVNAAATREDVHQNYGIDREKCPVFYNTLADPLPNRPELRDPEVAAYRVACVGRMDFSKGQDVLLRAIARVKNTVPEVEVQFVGGGPSQAAYQKLATELGIAERCQFIGGVPHEEVFKRMAASAVTVVPSRSEAFGWVNTESMAVGTPVIASAVGGIVEIIRDGVDGFLVPPDDADALADRLEQLLTDPELREKMGTSARARFLAEFERQGMIERQVAWLEAITADVQPVPSPLAVS